MKSFFLLSLILLFSSVSFANTNGEEYTCVVSQERALMRVKISEVVLEKVAGKIKKFDLTQYIASKNTSTQTESGVAVSKKDLSSIDSFIYAVGSDGKLNVYISKGQHQDIWMKYDPRMGGFQIKVQGWLMEDGYDGLERGDATYVVDCGFSLVAG